MEFLGANTNRQLGKLLPIFLRYIAMLIVGIGILSANPLYANANKELEKPPSRAITAKQNSIANTTPNTNKALTLSLKEAVVLALRDNFSARDAYLSRITDRFALRVAEEKFKPRLSLVGSSRYNKVDNTDAFDQSIGTSVSVNLPIGGQLGLSVDTAHSNSDTSSYDTNVNLNISQPLLRDAGLTVGQASLVSARRNERISQLGLQRSLSNIINGVISQYRRYVSNTRSLRIAELSVERAEKQLEVDSALLDAGRIARFDLIQSQTNVANQQISLQSTKNALRNEEVGLLRTLRLPVKTRLVLDNTISLTPLPQLTLAQAIKIAFRHRVDYQQAQLGLESSKLSLKLAENAQRWDVRLEGSYALNGSANDLTGSIGNGFSSGQGDYAVGVQLNIPLDEDLTRKQSLLSAQVGLIKSRNSLINLEESIRLELSQQLEDVVFLWKQVELSKQALKLTKQQLENEQIKRGAGSANNVDLISFDNALIRAENNYVSTQLNYLNSLTTLDNALGTTLKTWGINIKPQFTTGKIDRYSIQRQE